MEDFTAIYKILKALYAAMDYDEFDMDMISAERLHISVNKRIALLEMLYKNGYIDGLTVKRSADGHVQMNIRNPRITLQGLEYFIGNQFMKKASDALKGIEETIPGI